MSLGLRALVANIVSSPQYADENLMAGLPPLLGPDLLLAARARFNDQEEMRPLFRALAEAVLSDNEDRSRPVSTKLESMVTFAVRRKTVGKFIDGPSLTTMVFFDKPRRREAAGGIKATGNRLFSYG